MKQILFPFIAILLLASCASQKNITYIQDAANNYTVPIGKEHNAIIKSGDCLSIVVNSRDMDLSHMFNLPVISPSLTDNNANASGTTNRISGYEVDDEGNIDFPQLGTLKVSGLDLVELSTLIKKRLIDQGLLQDPVVTSQFINFNVTVLGEVSNPGIFGNSFGHLTILDALGKAGDLTIYGRRDNVKVIREENSVKKVAVVDLRSKQLLGSPYYYLQQNDVVYVEPNKVKAGQSEINTNRSVSTYAAILSVLISLSVLIFK